MSSYMLLQVCAENDDIKDMYVNDSIRDGDAGFDVRVSKDTIVSGRVKDGNRATLLPTGLSCQAYLWETNNYPECKHTGFFLYPRSSIGIRTPLVQANSVGVIDSGYIGEIKGTVFNMDETDFVVKKGERLFQIVSPNMIPIRIEWIKELKSLGTRGVQGFGSTGN